MRRARVHSGCREDAHGRFPAVHYYLGICFVIEPSLRHRTFASSSTSLRHRTFAFHEQAFLGRGRTQDLQRTPSRAACEDEECALARAHEEALAVRGERSRDGHIPCRSEADPIVLSSGIRFEQDEIDAVLLF